MPCQGRGGGLESTEGVFIYLYLTPSLQPIQLSTEGTNKVQN